MTEIWIYRLNRWLGPHEYESLLTRILLFVPRLVLWIYDIFTAEEQP